MSVKVLCDYCAQEILDSDTSTLHLSSMVQPFATPVRVDLHGECVDPYKVAAGKIHGQRPAKPATPNNPTK